MSSLLPLDGLPGRELTFLVIVVTGLWRPRRIDCKRRQKVIWIHYEVGDLLLCGLLDLVVRLAELFLAMTASQMRIAETIDAFYGDAGTKDGVSRS